jgi:hypothetical protein
MWPFGDRTRKWKIATRFVPATVMMLVLGLSLWSLIGYRSRLRNEARCTSHIYDIGYGLLVYYHTNARFPVPTLCGKNGRPLLSWRAEVLHYMDWTADFYFEFDEPWDSPHNAWASRQAVNVFVCPNHGTADPLAVTSYVLITGPGTFFDGDHSTGDFKSRRQNNPECFLLVETTSIKRNWAAPGDISIEDLSLIINDPHGDSISSNDPSGPAVFLSTGEVRRIKSIQQLRQLIPMLSTPPEQAKKGGK